MTTAEAKKAIEDHLKRILIKFDHVNPDFFLDHIALVFQIGGREIQGLHALFDA